MSFLFLRRAKPATLIRARIGPGIDQRMMLLLHGGLSAGKALDYQYHPSALGAGSHFAVERPQFARAPSENPERSEDGRTHRVRRRRHSAIWRGLLRTRP